MKNLVVGGSGFIGSYLMKELDADNLDLKEGKDVRKGIKGEYGAIVFLACNQGNSKEAYQENWDMFKALDKYRKDSLRAPYLVYISSAAVYTLNSWYAISKQLGEAYAMRFPEVAILRPSNVYGHGDGHGAPDKFMSGGKIIEGSGQQIRDLIPVEKVVSEILLCLRERETGIFNVSSGVGTTVRQMFKLFGEGEPIYNRSAEIGVERSILPPGEVIW